MDKKTYITSLEKKIKELEEELKTLKTNNYGINWNKVKENIQDNTDITIEELKDKSIIEDSSLPLNYLIEGENYYALKYLQENYQEEVDIIYIDPPYNTGIKDFLYNDSFIDKKDKDRHSKWLSFMEKRLLLAKELLSQKGIIFISIDEYEHANLELLMNSIFGEENRIEDIIWMKNSNKNNTKTISTIHEYILMYAKDLKHLIKSGKGFKKEKYGLSDLNSIRDSFLQEDLTKFKQPHKELERRIRNYIKKNKSHPEIKEIINFNRVEEDTYKIFGLADMSSPNRKGLRYEVIHPITQLPCKIPSRGWIYKKETMEEKIKNNEVYFGENETTHPYLKKYLDNVKYNPIRSVIQNNDKGILDLRDIIRDTKYFNNPKPVSLIKFLIEMSSDKDSIILDFFAGSGTTGQAVMELNKKDNGKRQFVLCTNNENNICHHITYPRIKSVIYGYTNRKGNYIEGIPSNVIYKRIRVQK